MTEEKEISVNEADPNQMTSKEFSAFVEKLGFTSSALAELLDRKPSTINHYRNDFVPPREVVKKVRRLKKVLEEFKLNG